MPALHQLEKRVDKDKEHIYEHIDASHQILKNRMDQLDRKTNQHLDAFDRWSRDRFDDEEQNCYRRIDQRLADHQQHAAYQNRGGGMNVDDWLEAKLSEYGHCLDHHHDDTALPNNNIFMDIHNTENGRLFRSRSDETLSQSDNHSGRFRKRQFYESRQQAMQQIRAWQLPSYENERTIRNPVVGRRFNNGVQQTIIHSANPQRSGQNFVSPIPSQQNRSSSRPDFISPSTASTNRSPYLSHDQIYGSQYGGYEHGAIPKKLPTSQTWHGANELRTAVNNSNSQNYNSLYGQRSTVLRDSSPLNHSTPYSKSRESSPYDYPPQRSLLKSRTETERTSLRQTENRNIQNDVRTIENDSGNIQSESRPIQAESRMNQQDAYSIRQQYHNSGNVQIEGKMNGAHFDRHKEVRRSNIEPRNLNSEVRNSDTRRSFPERGSSNTSTGTNVTSNSSSTGQGPLTESSAGKRPTFTTFGYPEQNNTQNEGQENQVNYVQNQDSSNVKNYTNSSNHQLEVTYGRQRDLSTKIPYSETVMNSTKDRNPTPLGRQGTPTGKTGSQNEKVINQKIVNANDTVNSVNRDDMYIAQGQNVQMNRQRSKSSDGILLEDDLTSAYQMKQQAPNLSSSQQLGFPNSPRGGQAYNVKLETLKRTNPVYGSARSYSNERNGKSLRAFSNEQGRQTQGEQIQRPYSSDKIDQVQRPYSNDRSNQGSRPYSSDYSPRPYTNSPVNRNVHNLQYHSASSVNRGQYQGQETQRQQFSAAKDIQSSRMYDVQDVQSGRLYNQGSRDRPLLANDSSGRENPYGSSQNYTRRPNDDPTSGRSMYNVYNPNFQGSTGSIYNDHSNVQRISSKSESNLNQTSHDSYTGADRNLQSTPIQDKSREDNSSNPDSGYSSKIFGRNTNSGNAPSTSCTPSSSFSTEPTDHNITLSSNNSPHPQINNPDYAQFNSVGKRQYQKDLTEHVQSWYQRKLKDAAKNLNDTDYGCHGDFRQANSSYGANDRYAGYDFVQPSQQSQFQGNHRFTNYQQVPSYIHGSDV